MRAAGSTRAVAYALAVASIALAILFPHDDCSSAASVAPVRGARITASDNSPGLPTTRLRVANQRTGLRPTCLPRPMIVHAALLTRTTGPSPWPSEIGATVGRPFHYLSLLWRRTGTASVVLPATRRQAMLQVFRL